MSTTKCSPQGAIVATWQPHAASNDMATTRGERLRMAREKHFKSARLAGKAMGMAVSTHGAHEPAEAPGGRHYRPNGAQKDARPFGGTPGFLLTGRRPFPS